MICMVAPIKGWRTAGSYTQQRLMSQGQPVAFQPVPAVDIPATEAAVQVLQDEAVAEVDGGMVWHRRPDLHENHVMFLWLALDRHKPRFGVVVEVEVSALVPPAILAGPFLQCHPELAPVVIVHDGDAIKHAMLPGAADQWRLVAFGLEHIDLVRHTAHDAAYSPR